MARNEQDVRKVKIKKIKRHEIVFGSFGLLSKLESEVFSKGAFTEHDVAG